MTTNLSESVFIKLQQEILEGTFPAGSRLPSERTLSLAHKVSRVTIRDAVRKLSQLGLIVKKPQSGNYVCAYKEEASLDLLIHIMRTSEAVDLSLLISLMEFRRTNEVFAARKAAQNITPAGITYLTELMEGLKANADNRSYLAEMDYTLHYKIAVFSNNLVLKLMFHSFRPIYHYYTHFFYHLEGTGPASIDLHQKVVSAICARDEAYASYAMEKALIYSENKMKDALGPFKGNKTINL
ncbi:MAG: FadR family transcriptional regulator [Proteobacteria bacterium]|nr:FadR family transcriptional regulator [Pseudomonadota bacterium]